jgi:hypothetical protein
MLTRKLTVYSNTAWSPSSAVFGLSFSLAGGGSDRPWMAGGASSGHFWEKPWKISVDEERVKQNPET